MRQMKLSIVVFVLTLLANDAKAQLLPTYYDTIALGQEVILDGNVEYFSSSIEKDITSKFIRGGFISSEMKENSFDKHSGVNRLGGYGILDLEYRNYNIKLLKKKDWGLSIKGGYGSLGSVLYSKDAFGVLMYGNEMYRGETMDLSGSNLNAVTYQKIGVGLIDPISKSNVSLNFFNISNRLYGHSRNFELTQDALGDSIDVTLNGEFLLKQNNKFNQGFGVGFDIDFKLPINFGEDRTAFIQFQMKNIGFGYLYEKQKEYIIDTTISFGGFELNQLIGEGNLFSDSTNVLDNIGVQSKDRTKTFMLPGFIQVGKIVDNLSVRKFQSFYGLRLFPSLIYSPFVYGGVDYHPFKWLNVGVNASFGGFGKFKSGLYSSMKFNNYSVALGTENIHGLFSKKAMGESILIKLIWAL